MNAVQDNLHNYKLSNDTHGRSNQKSNTTLLIAYLSFVQIRNHE